MAHSRTVDSIHALWPNMAAITAVRLTYGAVSGSVFPCTFGWRPSVQSQCSVQYVALRAAVAWRNTLLHCVTLETLNSVVYEARERGDRGGHSKPTAWYMEPEQCSLAWVFKEIIR
jgi:hypothetical protein